MTADIFLAYNKDRIKSGSVEQMNKGIQQEMNIRRQKVIDNG